MLKTLALPFLLLASISLHGEGFRGDTLVYTPIGFQPISIIGKGMQVYCYSTEGKLVLGNVTNSEKFETYAYDSLNVSNEEIHADSQQCFFCPMRNAWIKLVDLDMQKDSLLSLQHGPVSVQNRQRVSTVLRNIKVPMYKISVQDHQNFLITKKCILVHNYAPPRISLNNILINTAIDLGVNIMISYVSELVTKEIAPKLKNACAKLIPGNNLASNAADPNERSLINFNLTQPSTTSSNIDSSNILEVTSARALLINKFNAQPCTQNSSILTVQNALPQTEINQLVKELAGKDAQVSADGSYWFSIEKLFNGGILTRRNHFPIKVTGADSTHSHAAQFEIHYTHHNMPEKTKTIVAVHVPVKE